MEAAPSASVADEHRTINRELSWLAFNARVLALAENPDLPLLERAKFLAIFSQNLDEFFQIRVSGLHEQVRAGLGSGTDGASPREQLKAIRSEVERLLERVAHLFNDQIAPALEKENMRFVDWNAISDEDRDALEVTYYDRIFPVLTPLSVDPAHPFPYISSLSLNLAAIVRDPDTGLRRFARVKVPPLLPRFVPLSDGERFLPLEVLIAAQLQSLFPGMQLVEHHPFRVTRDADHDIEEDEADDLLGAVQSVIRRRQRSAKAVRLEIDATMPEEMRTLLMRELDLTDDDDVYVSESLLDLGALWGLYALERPELKEEPWPPVTQPRLSAAGDQPPNIFRVLRDGDVLLHHPYDSFTTSVETFVEQAAEDPKVLAIKQTLYRTSGRESRILRALSRAAEAGKQVVALVELTARFDEATNIDWARALETAGVHVVYGVVGLKTHAKCCLVVRNESSGVRRYVHVATGNYNEKTARLYEDVGLLTADEALGRDVTDLFNFLTGYSRQREFRKLLVAPSNLRDHIMTLIEREAHPTGRITMKVNSVVDPAIIDALYAASAAGASIDLIVRGICCLRAGVPGLSGNIRVRSIVGRFLEHSRIYRFGNNGDTEYYISSADLMERNLDRRVESATPITEPALMARIDEILDACLADDVLAWSLEADDTWRHVQPVDGVNAQRRLFELAQERNAGS